MTSLAAFLSKNRCLAFFLLLVISIAAINIYGLCFDNSFLSVFNKKRAGFYVVSEEVMNRIQRCCNDRELAIRLLHENGFKTNLRELSDTAKRALSIKESKVDHDSYVVAHRGPGIVGFWRILTRYEITLYVKNNKIVKTYAVVDTTYP